MNNYKYEITRIKDGGIQAYSNSLIDAVGWYFGCNMAENPVYIYDIGQKRKLEFKEFEKEFEIICKQHNL